MGGIRYSYSMEGMRSNFRETFLDKIIRGGLIE